MKTLILSLLLTGSSLALWAQDTIPGKDTTGTDTTGAVGITGQPQDTDTVNTMRSTGAYGAYGAVNVPTTIQNTFQSQYSNASNAVWERDTATNMWKAKYTSGGRILNVFMNESGSSYTLALPVIQSSVSENVISSAINKYGFNVYDVLQLKTGDSQYVYQVRLIENGQVRTVHMNEDGSDATYTYAVHTSEADSAANMQSDWDNQNRNKMDTANMMDTTNRMQDMNTSDTMKTNQDTNINNPDASGNQSDTLNATDPDQGVNNLNDNNEAVLGNNNTNTENRRDTKKKKDDTQQGDAQDNTNQSSNQSGQTY